MRRRHASSDRGMSTRNSRAASGRQHICVLGTHCTRQEAHARPAATGSVHGGNIRPSCAKKRPGRVTVAGVVLVRAETQSSTTSHHEIPHHRRLPRPRHRPGLAQHAPEQRRACPDQTRNHPGRGDAFRLVWTNPPSGTGAQGSPTRRMFGLGLRAQVRLCRGVQPLNAVRPVSAACAGPWSSVIAPSLAFRTSRPRAPRHRGAQL